MIQERELRERLRKEREARELKEKLEVSTWGTSHVPLIFEHFARVWELAWALCVAIDNVSDGLVIGSTWARGSPVAIILLVRLSFVSLVPPFHVVF